MKKLPRKFYNALRAIVVTVLVTAVALYAGLYVALLIPSVQQRIKNQSEKVLSEYLGTQVSIDKIDITPFDQLVLHNVLVPDQGGDSLLRVDKLGAGIDLKTLITERRIVVTYGEIIGLHGKVTRPDKDSPTNLQFIIDVFKPKPNQPPKPFDVQINNVVIRKSDLSYDVLNEPRKPGRFDANHLKITDLKADIALPRLKNDDFDIDIKRLAFKESSGFDVKHLSLHALVTNQRLDLKDINIELPNSKLKPGDISLEYSSLTKLGDELRTMPLSLSLRDATVTPSDFMAFEPRLGAYNSPLNVSANVSGNRDFIDVPALSVSSGDDRLQLQLSGNVQQLGDPAMMHFALPQLKLKARNDVIADVIRAIPGMSPQASAMLGRCGSVDIDAALNGNLNALSIDGKVGTSLGAVDLNGRFAQNAGAQHFGGHVVTSDFALGQLLDKRDVVGNLALDANVDATLHGKDVSGTVDGKMAFIDLKGQRYHNIVANIGGDTHHVHGTVSVDDPLGRITAQGEALLAGADSRYDVHLITNGLQTHPLGLMKSEPNQSITMNIDANVTGNNLDNLIGTVAINDMHILYGDGDELAIDNITIDSHDVDQQRRITLSSDFINGSIDGNYDYHTLVPSIKGMLSKAFPQFFAAYNGPAGNNNLNFKFVIDPDENLQNKLKLPVKLVVKTTVDGYLHEQDGTFALNLEAPYILQGKNIIEGTKLNARLDSITHNVELHASTMLPSKKGQIALQVDAQGKNDHLDTDLSWRVMRDHDFHGNINLTTLLDRNESGKMKFVVDVNPTEVVFNDTTWHVDPGRVYVDGSNINVENISGYHDRQSLKINGKASHDPDDVLCLELNDVSLDYVFETLNITHVQFGGRATGKFYASDVFSKSPRLSTPQLHVDRLAYNGAVMGDADIESHWVHETRAVALRADLSQYNGEHSIIDGAIFAADDSLYLDFDAHRANVAFMKPYMAAFTSDVQGEVSGHAVLLGNFHTINLEGDIKADSLRFLLDYTNVYYTCAGDSVHMEPNLITFDNVLIHDRDGHEARMGGWLRHDSFHKPVFNFAITDARDLLCYDTNENINPDWYGTIYGNGAAFVAGEPGMVDIKVNMTSAPRSKFTFVLSDTEEASEYSFITFRDRDAKDVPIDTVPVEDDVPEIVKQLKARVQHEEEGEPTHYNIDLQGDITPDAQLIIVMDPVGGDRIRAYGSGNMRLTYNDNDEMTMFGKYTLERGSYNFTLQDIIIKDFTIKNGSSISFQGDPYAAVLDLEAVYALTANLRDLDETFSQDKEIARTNVPVHALLRAKGLISQPEISFDIELPTLTADSYRKVKSIVSTDDQMNRQIIYLLALNRFYTPDYMNSTSRNNELTSVASSTISSQLSNMLGKVSDKWTISPNFRSEKGDLSDMEFDLALSSQLLNNRLILNGNFGYRDNTYDTRSTNFIGDFDIEYLLNERGTLRLKAYNHFNDQNYYVRNALTTQGVGLVWKHDFDRPENFNKRLRELTKAKSDSLPQDGVTSKTDSQ